MKYTAVIVGLVFAATPLTVKADRWWAFCNFRQVDPAGRFYIVVKKGEGAPEDPGRGTPVAFEFAERKPGSSPVKKSQDEGDFDRVTPNSEVKVRVGDIIHGGGEFMRCPHWILISSTGHGFVGIDVRGYNFGLRHTGDAVVIVGKEGTFRHRKALIDLFSEEEIGRFHRTGGGIDWAGGGWIEERRREVIVVSKSGGTETMPVSRLFRIVNFETGQVRPGSSQEIVTALAEHNAGAIQLALDLTTELKLKDAHKHVPGIFADEQLPLEARLQAAVFLAELGDKRGAQLMSKSALESSEEQCYAIVNLPVLLGDKAAPVLCDVVRRFGNDRPWPAEHAMGRISSEAAIPELIRLLEEKASLASQTFAADLLGRRGAAAKAAVLSLMRMLEDPPQMHRFFSNHYHAANALGSIGPAAKEALPLLIRLAERHAPDEWARVKDMQPELRSGRFAQMRYSDDDYINAICKIRKK